jgi:VIT1/CCC1 family predicted Fe2+/Mn2+ transporter
MKWWTSVSRYHDEEGTRQAIFGSFDGLTSALGVMAAAYLTSTAHVLVAAACGLAIAAAVSMAGGEFLSETSGKEGQVNRAGIMAVATFVGSFLPAIPFLFQAKPAALIVAGVLVLAAAVAIAQYRVPSQGMVRAYLQTYGILVVAAGLSIGVTLLFNLAG